MTYRVRNIIIAAALALTAAMLALFYVANYKRHVQHSESTVRRLRREGRHPGRHIRRRHLEAPHAGLVARWSSAPIVPGAISNADQVQNLVTTAPIYSGEQVTLRRFANHVELGPRAQLHGTLRAITLEGDSAQVLAGTLKSGDHVDMVATLEVLLGPPRASSAATSRGTSSSSRRPTRAARSSGHRRPSSIMLAASDRARRPEDLVGGEELDRLDAPAPPGHERHRQPGGRREHGVDDGRRAELGQCQSLQPGGCKVSTETETDPDHTRLLHRRL